MGSSAARTPTLAPSLASLASPSRFWVPSAFPAFRSNTTSRGLGAACSGKAEAIWITYRPSLPAVNSSGSKPPTPSLGLYPAFGHSRVGNPCLEFLGFRIDEKSSKRRISSILVGDACL
ncbi:hypothetical protein GY45DRAFT_1438797 [Cubamyces sp. BRFM 1775]|nr:hypothetical protein GY45DRAFT_1438797 [Cubamyces sp. BRFM 1775]